MGVPRRLIGGGPVVADAIALASSLLVAFSFGFSYGNVGNQSTYLLHALNRLDPRFLRNDWFVQETTPYHGAFQWLVRLADLFGSVPWGLAWLNLGLCTAGLFLVYRIASTLAGRDALAAFAVTLLFVLVEPFSSIAMAYVFYDGLQPSTPASIAWLFAMLQFLRKRFAWSGVALAAGGVFHANFLVLGIGLFALAQLVSSRRETARRLFAQIGPSALVLAGMVPLMLGVATGEGAAEARQVFLQIRSPHHYLPSTWLFDFWHWGGWMSAGIGAACLAGDRQAARSMLVLLGSIAACVVAATLLTTVVFVPAIAQLFVWRLAPFGTLASQVAVAAVAVRFATGDCNRSLRPALLPALLVVAGGLAVLRWHLHWHSIGSLEVSGLLGIAAVCLVPGMLRLAGWQPVRCAALIVGFSAAALAAPAWVERVGQTLSTSTLLGPGRNAELAALYRWARETPPDSVFLVPPGMHGFRLFAQRAVVVDWKSAPLVPSELLEWYRRIEFVAGRPVASDDDAIEGYRARSLDELRAVAVVFGAQFVVLDAVARKREPGAGEEPVFVAGRYVVHPTRPVAAASKRSLSGWP